MAPPRGLAEMIWEDAPRCLYGRSVIPVGIIRTARADHGLPLRQSARVDPVDPQTTEPMNMDPINPPPNSGVSARSGRSWKAAGRVLAAYACVIAPLAAQQASITLQNSDAEACYVHNNTWSLKKEVKENTVENGAGKVTWTVTATKDSSAAPTFTVHGGLTIFNSGSAPATIGNIVMNLQRTNTPKKGGNASHVSIAANVATAKDGDAATSASIVAAGSQETASCNGAWGTNNYTTSSSAGTFTETAGSGTLEFTDASNNTIFKLTPQPVIPVGQAITLLYHATFQVSALPPAGTPLRLETLVTFGNAGLRGGGGSTGKNIDANGNGLVDADEANVRTVPSRVTLGSVPAAPEECNDSVIVSDLEEDLTTSGTVTASDLQNFGAIIIDETTSFEVSAEVDAGESGGQVCNTVYLDGESDGGTLAVVLGYTPPDYQDITPNDGINNPVNVGSQPIYATYDCCTAAEESDQACALVEAEDSILDYFEDGSYFTYSQGGFQGGGVPGTLFENNFTTVFAPGGLTIGIEDGLGSKHDATWAATTAGRAALKSFLAGGGPSGALTGDTVDATSIAGGALAKQTAALTLNVAFNDAGVLTATLPRFGDLKFADLAGGSIIGSWTLTASQAAGLNGKSIRSVLGDANGALGGAGLPSYVGSFGDLNQLVTALNLSFHEGITSSFANNYLTP